MTKEKVGEGRKEEATYVNQESGAIIKDWEREIDSPRATSKRYVRGQGEKRSGESYW